MSGLDLAVFYAAVIAVENGQVGEIEIVDQSETEGTITVLRIVVRREVQPLELLGGVD